MVFPVRTRIPLLAALVVALLLGLGAAPAGAALIAAWDFDDGTANDQSGNGFDLTAVGGGPTIAGGFARFTGNDASPSFLEDTGPGGMPEYTVSLWVRNQGATDQGSFQGIFSNNNASGAAFSWQVESFGGVFQWRTQAGTFAIGAPTGGVGAWDHIVVRKFGGNDGDIWFNGVQVVANLGANPGGLQMFRLGTNRNSNRLYEMDLDDVQVHDTLVDPTALFAAAVVTEPAPTLAMALCAGLLGVRRRS
ncbi:MAG: hypothetical protein QNK05_25795 [Myxococcota bacterium]|nr:hypothetical protein [Myxococcota bacterium]